MHGEAAFVDVHGNIYACSSLMGRERYLLGNVHEGRDPERVKAVAALSSSPWRSAATAPTSLYAVVAASPAGFAQTVR